MKLSNNKIDTIWFVHQLKNFNTTPYYENIPDYIKFRAYKNYNRWVNNKNSLYYKIYQSEKS